MLRRIVPIVLLASPLVAQDLARLAARPASAPRSTSLKADNAWTIEQQIVHLRDPGAAVQGDGARPSTSGASRRSACATCASTRSAT